MQSRKHTSPIPRENSQDEAALKESGVRAIPPEARAALAALKALQAVAPPAVKTGQNADQDGKLDPRAVAPSTEPVCPKMVEAHKALVHQVVAPIARRVPANVQRDDLIAAGLFGLVDSLRRNGGDGGITFEWYAKMRIRGAVLDELRAQDWLSRRARDAVNAGANDPSAEYEGVSLVCLDELSDADEREFFSSFHFNPEAIYVAKETMQHLVVALDKLSERERTVVAMHYFEAATFKKIADKLDISETRAFQIHGRALDRMKNVLLGKRSSRSSARESSQPSRNDLVAEDWNDSPPDTERMPDVS